MSEKITSGVTITVEKDLFVHFDVYDDKVGIKYQSDGFGGRTGVKAGIRTHGILMNQQIIFTIPTLHRLQALLNKFFEVYEQEIGEEDD